MIRSRKPLYHRLLRLRHLRPGPLPTFVLFEGSVMVALLLALADLVDPWGILAIPVAVAVMVKLNDVIMVVLRRPVAAAQLDRPRLAGGPAIGISARPSTAHADDLDQRLTTPLPTRARSPTRPNRRRRPVRMA